MAFPVSPTNGQTAVVNNITYQFSNVGNTWTRLVSTANVITANTIVSNGVVSATGNVTGSYFLGNGALLTGIAGGTPSLIANGTSNVNVAISGGNVTVGVGGTASVAVFATTGAYITGLASVSGNIVSTANVSGGNILTSGLISATGTLSVSGNTTVANVSAGNISAGSLNTSGLISATANVSGGNVLTPGLVSAGGTVTGTSHLGSVVSMTGAITGASVVGGVITGTSSSVSGNVTGGNVLTAGLISATGNITGNVFIGNGSQLTGLPAGYSNSNLASLGSNVISTSGNVTGGNFLTGGLISAAGNITGGNITIPGSANISTFIGNTFFGSVPAQPTYYTIAPLNLNNSLAAATKVQLNLINTGGGAGAGSAIDFYTYQISVLAANAESRIAAIDDGNYSAYLSLQTKTPGSIGTNGLVERVKIDSTGASVAGNVTGSNVLTGGLISAAGAVTGTTITGTSLTVSTGNVSAGNIVNNNANGVGNIGSATVYFNTVFGKATTAQYADLAELYSADAMYAPGTVLDFGGTHEVTLSTQVGSNRIAGVVSTNPAHLMNSVLESEYTVAVALTGRVPTSVTGTIRKGDMMVSAGNGYAQASATPAMGTVIGKALENFDGVSGTIEIVVGRL